MARAISLMIMAVLFILPAGKVQATIDVDLSFFYDQLAPYGDWVTIDPYGWVWCPAHVEPGWRPYSDGYWAFTDFGWTWVSEVEWGWAAYHYGRWFFDDTYGWVWVPDVIWGPAWVAWRYGDGYVGWAPLPPDVLWIDEGGLDWGTYDYADGLRWYCWNFAEEQWFCRPKLRKHIFTPEHNIDFLKRTRDITKYEYVDERIMDRGPDVVEIERMTSQKIPRLTITEPPESARRHMTRVQGDDLILFSPHVSKSRIVKAPPMGMHRQSFDARSYKKRLQAYHNDQLRKLEEQQAESRRHPRPGVSKEDLESERQKIIDDVREHQKRETQIFENRTKNEQERQHKAQEHRKSGGKKKP